MSLEPRLRNPAPRSRLLPQTCRRGRLGPVCESQTGHPEPRRVSGRGGDKDQVRNTCVTLTVDTVGSPGVEGKAWKGDWGVSIILLTLKYTRFRQLDPFWFHGSLVAVRQAALIWLSLPWTLTWCGFKAKKSAWSLIVWSLAVVFGRGMCNTRTFTML